MTDIIDLAETAPGEWTKAEPAQDLPPPLRPAPIDRQPFWGDGESIIKFIVCFLILLVIKHYSH